jgi:hypothetical protein
MRAPFLSRCTNYSPPPAENPTDFSASLINSPA